MPDDANRFPIHDLLPDDASEADVARYAETVVRLLKNGIAENGGSVHGHSGVLLSVDLDGGEAMSRLRLHYRSHAGGEYDAYWEIWDDQGLTDPPMAAGRPNLESPASLVGLVASNWADGSIRADDDPYWHAVERQRQAMTEWRDAFPEAVAALPPYQPSATVDEQRAAWAEWAQRFPEAAARRQAIWRPPEDFLE